MLDEEFIRYGSYYFADKGLIYTRRIKVITAIDLFISSLDGLEKYSINKKILNSIASKFGENEKSDIKKSLLLKKPAIDIKRSSAKGKEAIIYAKSLSRKSLYHRVILRNIIGSDKLGNDIIDSFINLKYSCSCERLKDICSIPYSILKPYGIPEYIYKKSLEDPSDKFYGERMDRHVLTSIENLKRFKDKSTDVSFSNYWFDNIFMSEILKNGQEILDNLDRDFTEKEVSLKLRKLLDPYFKDTFTYIANRMKLENRRLIKQLYI